MKNLVWIVLVSMAMVCFGAMSVTVTIDEDITDYVGDTTVDLTLDSDGGSPENCSLSNDGSDWSSEFSFTTSYSDWDLTAYGGDGDDGSKTVYFRCADADDNGTIAQDNDDTTLDTTGPEISSESPTSSSVNDSTPEISADISDDDSGVDEDSIVLTLDGDDVSGDADYSSGEVTYTSSSDLDFGSHDVELSVADELGNTANESWSFTIVSEGVGFEDPEPENNTWIMDDRPEITITLEDTGSGIDEDSLTFEFDGDDVTDDADYSSSSGEFSYEPSSLDDDNYTVQVCAEDDLGEETCFEWGFGVDTTDPEISLLTPGDDDIVTSVSRITARLDDDDSGIDEDSIMMYLNDVSVTSSLEYDEDDGDVEFEPAVTLTGGEYEVEIWVDDNAGNQANVEWSFVIPSTAPEFDDEKPEKDSTIGEARPEISIEIDDPGTSGIDDDSLKMYLDGDLVDADWSSGVLSYTPDSDLGEGEHTVKVIADNEDRERSQFEWDFSVDLTAPDSPTNFKAEKTSSGTKLTWTAADDVDGYELYSSTTKLTTVSGRNPLEELDDDETSYTDTESGKRYYALVSVEDDKKSSPLFASLCAEYKSGKWTDYECCLDTDCDEGYTCNMETNECEQEEEEVTEDDAEDAIEYAEALIEAKENSSDLTNAENYLNSAKNSFNAGNYAEAERLANLARDSALSAPALEDSEDETIEEDSGKKKLPCCPSFVLLAILLFSALVARK